VSGSIRKRGSGWQVRVYAGVYDGSGAKRTISRTTRGTWADVDLDDQSILIKRAIVDAGGSLVEKDTKTHQVRRIAIGPDTGERLLAHRLQYEERASLFGVRLAADARVFARDPLGVEPWRPDSMTHRLVDARRKAGLGDQVRLHDMRHFLAT